MFSHILNPKNQNPVFATSPHDENHGPFRILSYSRFIGPSLRPMLMATKQFMHLARPTAYASELGESGKTILPSSVYKSLYVISGAYVLLDTAHKVNNLHHKLDEDPTFKDYTTNQKDMILTKKAGDTLLWHGLGSLFLPGFTIHAIVHAAQKSRKLITTTKIPKQVIRNYPPVLGLMAIPFIVHPLDELATYIMDNAVRCFYSEETCDLVNDDSHH